MNWSYVFGKNMTVTDQHKKYWHIEAYETDELQEKGYVVDTLDINSPADSTFLKRNPTHGVGTLETAVFDWSNAAVSIKRYEEVYQLKAPVIEVNGSNVTKFTLKVSNPNDASAPTLCPTCTFHSQDLGDTTYEIKPGEYVLIDFNWNKEEDEPESRIIAGYFTAFHCTDSSVTRVTAKKEVVPQDLVCSATTTLDTSTGAFKQVNYTLKNINDYAIVFHGTLKLDDTTLLENFEIGAQASLNDVITTDGFQLTLDGAPRAKEE